MKKVFVLVIAVSVMLVFTVYFFAMQKPLREYEVGENVKLLSSKTGVTDLETVWCGTFQLAWNELKNYVGGNVEFVEEENELVNILNNSEFTKEMLSEEDCYIKVGKPSEDLKNQISKDLAEKFKIKNTDFLDSCNFTNTNGIFIYTMLNKQFNYPQKLEDLKSNDFTDKDGNRTTVRYFGKDYKDNSQYEKTVEVLFYKDYSTYGVKLNTKENEEVILYMTSDVQEKNFEELYSEIETYTNEYSGEKELGKEDILKIPYISLETMINYEELCNKTIEGKDTEFIAYAIQNMNFILTATGGQVVSEAKMETKSMSYAPTTIKNYDFSYPFVIFIKEKDKVAPYFKAKILDNTFLEKI